jgi:hypothetical protein
MNTTILLKLPVLHPFRVVQLLILAMGVVGSTTDDPTIQRIIAIGISLRYHELLPGRSPPNKQP